MWIFFLPQFRRGEDFFIFKYKLLRESKKFDKKKIFFTIPNIMVREKQIYLFIFFTKLLSVFLAKQSKYNSSQK